MLKPSFSSSPCIFGAPHPAFSNFIWRMRFRISSLTLGRPPGRRDRRRQYSRKPFRCHAITVAGFNDIQNIGPARPLHPQHDPKEPAKGGSASVVDVFASARRPAGVRRAPPKRAKATAKENPEGGKNCYNDLDHRSALACRDDALAHRVFAWHIIDLASFADF